MIKIRMSRGGRANLPVFTIVATDSKSPRDSKFLEKLGQYNPRSQTPLVGVKVEAIEKWLKAGAQLSDTVKTVLKKEKVKISL